MCISLTSIPERFSFLPLTLRNLVSQSIKPDKIVLTIFKEDFDKLPTKYLQGFASQVEVILCDKQIRSYKKLIPALKRYPSSIFVTADDDLYYSRNWLKKLLAKVENGNSTIYGLRGYRIDSDDSDEIRKYTDWTWLEEETFGSDIFLTSGSGIAFPPGSFSPEVLNERQFMQLAPLNDDMWFYFMIRLNGRVYGRLPGNAKIHNWRGSQIGNLSHDNLLKGCNDVAFKNLAATYGNPLVELPTCTE